MSINKKRLAAISHCGLCQKNFDLLPTLTSLEGVDFLVERALSTIVTARKGDGNVQPFPEIIICLGFDYV